MRHRAHDNQTTELLSTNNVKLNKRFKIHDILALITLQRHDPAGRSRAELTRSGWEEQGRATSCWNYCQMRVLNSCLKY